MTTTEGEASVNATQPKIKSRLQMINEIRKSDTPYFVKNNTNTRVTCATVTPPLSLGPAGRGEDVALLPKEALNEPGFQRMWAQGKLSISDDPAMEEEMVLSALTKEERRQSERDKATAEIEEPASNRDLVQETCLISGDPVWQTVADKKNMVPPLAPAYKDRAHEFTPTVTQDERGEQVVKFSRVTIEQ